MPISRGLLILLAYVAQLNVKIEMFGSIVVVAMTCTVVFVTLRRHNTAVSLWLVAGCVGLIASWCQYQNYLWGMQIDYFGISLCAVAAVSLLIEPRLKRAAIAAGMGVVASLLSIQGLVVWAVGLLVLFQKRAKWRLRFGWALLGVTVILVYLQGYEAPHELWTSTMRA